MTLLVALLLAVPPPGPLPAERFEQANALYRAGELAAAAAEYERLASEGWVSPSLHLNLGDARMRLGQRGRAIASWERALRLDPGDADARENLRAARIDDPDRALSGEPTLSARLVERTGDSAAAAAFLASWWALWGLLALRRVGRGGRRALLGAAALVAALCVAASALLLAGRANERRLPAAIVAAPVAPVREGPSAALKASFELHEGTRVRWVDAEGDYARIRLDGGLEGWVARAALEPL